MGAYINSRHLDVVEEMYKRGVQENDVRVHLRAALTLLQCHLVEGRHVFDPYTGMLLGPLNLKVINALLEET